MDNIKPFSLYSREKVPMEVGLQYHHHDLSHYLPKASAFSAGNRFKLSFQLHTQRYGTSMTRGKASFGIWFCLFVCFSFSHKDYY